MRRPKRRAQLVACMLVAGALVLGWSAVAAAQGASPRCLRAFDGAQRFRRSGELLLAQKSVERCLMEDCLEVLRAQCGEWRLELAREMPTIRVIVTGVAPKDLLNAELLVDGKSAPAGLRGAEIEVDPGEHVVRLELDGRASQDVTVAAAIGQKRSVVRIRLDPPARTRDVSPAPDRDPEREGFMPHPVTWAAFALSSAGLMLGTATGIAALVQKADLEEQCATTGCSAQEIDDGRIIGDVSTGSFVVAGVGAVVGIGVLLIGALTDAPADEPATAWRVTSSGYVEVAW